MHYVSLGRTALRISRICLGTLNLGVRTTLDEGVALMDAARGSGINFFDTANQYGWQVHKGYTEEVLGKWFARGGGRRDDIVLATKVGNPMTEAPNDQGLSARNIIASCEQSLRRLGTDWIDLYQMHHVDRTAPWEEIWSAMEMLIAQGKIRYVGSSNFAGWHLAAAQESARVRHLVGLVSEQCLYNLVSRHAETEVIPAAQHYGLAVLTWSPLHGGLLGGALRKLESGTAVKTAQGRAMVALEEHEQTIRAYEKLCDGAGLDPAHVALTWVLARDGVSAAVIGPRTPAHLETALDALDARLAPDVEQALATLFPPVGRGGPAPEAWAW